MTAHASALERLLGLTAALPEVSVGTSYGDPSLRVRDKAFVTLKDETTLVLRVPLDHKELLLTTAPDIYYETDHYKGWPGVLIRVPVISDDELALRLRESWLYKAPKKLAATLLE
jgi:hypothetical protein